MTPKILTGMPAPSVHTPQAKAKVAAAPTTPAIPKATVTPNKSKAPKTTPARKLGNLPGRAQPKAVPVVLPVPRVPAFADPFRESKQAYLIAQLRNPAGASIDQMITLTGWQAHTIRGTISAVLRKKLGLNVICEAATGSGTRRYRIFGSALA